MSIASSVPHPNREQLILSHLPQVELLARRMPVQPERHCLLKTIAEHRIQGAMLDYLRQLDPLSRSVRRFRPPPRGSTAHSRSTSPPPTGGSETRGCTRTLDRTGSRIGSHRPCRRNPKPGRDAGICLVQIRRSTALITPTGETALDRDIGRRRPSMNPVEQHDCVSGISDSAPFSLGHRFA